MASAPSSESLSQTLLGLLADAAFVFAEPSVAPMPANGSPLVARLNIEHGETWELCVCVQDKLGDMLAAFAGETITLHLDAPSKPFVATNEPSFTTALEIVPKPTSSDAFVIVPPLVNPPLSRIVPEPAGASIT